ncbi:MAG: hypothetical protein KKH94_10305 [Candidatus Omnitrophica bacterium]|nr:hypothetical protein [Candidatus Omnitrophota bacterium]
MFYDNGLIRKFVCIFLCGFFIISMPIIVRGDNEVSVQVTAIMAAHESDFVDPELIFIADEVKTLFTYSSFRKIKRYTILLGDKQRDRITLPRKQDLVISYNGVDEEGKIALTISMGDILNTDITLIDGGHILIGGPEYEDGTLILLFEAKK